jgi:hypothetical protein
VHLPDGVKDANSLAVSTRQYRLLVDYDTATLNATWITDATPCYHFTRVHDGHQLPVRAYCNAEGQNPVRFDNIRAEERGS